MLYLLAILFVGWSNYEVNQPLWYRRAGGAFILWVLLGVLGWAVFGAAIHR